MKRYYLYFLLALSILMANTLQAQFKNTQIVCDTENKEAKEAFKNGQESLALNKTKYAIKFFYLAVQLDSEYCDAWDNLGLCYRMQNDFQTALYCYYKSSEANPKNPIAYQNAGYTWLNYGYPLKAAESFQKLIELDTLSTEGYYGFAMAMEMYDSNQIALASIEKAIAIYKADRFHYGKDVRCLHGILLAKNCQFEQAIQNLEDVYSKFKEIEQVNAYLGLSYYHYKGNDKNILKKRIDKARKYLKKAKELGTKLDESILTELTIE